MRAIVTVASVLLLSHLPTVAAMALVVTSLSLIVA